ncbi:MAG: hypothetical protein E7318_09725 [Clostridiales bacterium]|nr:hypothetical protein [Clostridiales bacterium]
MKIIGILLIIIGIIGIVLTVLLPEALGYAGLIAGATAILTGVVFLASCSYRATNYCQRRNNDCGC